MAKPTLQIEESIQTIEYLQKQYAENKIGRYATILKETGEFIGWTGIKFINDHVENGHTNFTIMAIESMKNFGITVLLQKQHCFG